MLLSPPTATGVRPMAERCVPKEFNDANIAAARRFKAERDALVKALEEIAVMDPFGIRADDLGRAARIAREALRAPALAGVKQP